MNQPGFTQAGEFTLREPPKRDPFFHVVLRDAEMHEYADNSDLARREMLHRHMTNEITSIEIAAACLSEFPDAPWELRMELARQCADESRHVRALHRRLQQIGGHAGEFPISTFEWNVTSAVDNLVGRLAIQNRTLEAGAIDVVAALAQAFRSAGDAETADVLDAINADEVHHVRFANRWIRRMAGEDRRVLMKMASAVRFLAAVNAWHQIKDGGETNAVGTRLQSPVERIPAVNVEDRKLAEFTDEEIHEVLRQAGFRALVAQDVTP